jgi:hypothetical protein
MNRNRISRTGLFIAAIFLFPVLAAYVIAQQEWYEKGYTNKGDFFEETIKFQTYSLDNPLKGLWQIAYVMPAQCTSRCLEQLKLMKNSWLTLGRKQAHVGLTVFITPESAHHDSDKIKQPELFHWVSAPSSMLDQLHSEELMIVDPRGHFILHYDVSEQVSTSDRVLGYRDLILDLRKLLMFSEANVS